MQICEVCIGPLDVNSLLISMMAVKTDMEFHVNFILSFCFSTVVVVSSTLCVTLLAPLFAVSVTAASRVSLVTSPYGLPYVSVVGAWCMLINWHVHVGRRKCSFPKTCLCCRFCTYLLVCMRVMPLKGIQLTYAHLKPKGDVCKIRAFEKK